MECKAGMTLGYSPPLTSFNRNIVECKVSSSSLRFFAHSSFNRNIVECKVVNNKDELIGFLVLIETLWNVKFLTASEGVITNEF